MKIYILPCQSEFQRQRSPFRYPRHSKDWGIEQDFLKYLHRPRPLLTNDPQEADWHYLPIFWTRWHYSHKYGKIGVPELQAEVDRILRDDRKTFTVCQFDDGPVVKIGEAAIFWGCRKTDQGIDIPLLCSPHWKPLFSPAKKYLASFIGRIATHPMRQEMAAQLAHRHDVYLEDTPVYDQQKPAKYFVRNLLESYIALCPRGYGGSSFRFFEAMQLGVVPFLIGDLDTRPFKRFINWDEMSFWAQSVEQMKNTLNMVQQATLIQMGKRAADVYKEQLAYQKWCAYVLRELETVI